MRQFIARLRHDQGTVKISLDAESYDAAVERIMATELCPARSILWIKEMHS